MRRRRFLEIVVASTISLGASAAEASIEKKAIAFDGFVIFDPKSVAALAENLFPGKGPDLMNAWGLRQFEYSWLRNSMGRYADFWTITSQALHFAARLTKLDLSKEKHDQLMNGFLEMTAYPDVQPALQTLSDAGLRLGFLSNLTEAMMEANIKARGSKAGSSYCSARTEYRRINRTRAPIKWGRRLRAGKTTDPICRLSRMGRRRG